MLRITIISAKIGKQKIIDHFLSFNGIVRYCVLFLHITVEVLD